MSENVEDPTLSKHTFIDLLIKVTKMSLQSRPRENPIRLSPIVLF